jgi:hypothetical protein
LAIGEGLSEDHGQNIIRKVLHKLRTGVCSLLAGFTARNATEIRT